MSEKMYGIWDKKNQKLLDIEVEGNGDAEDCNSYQASLTTSGETPYLTKERKDAERTLKGEGKWWGSGMCIPMINEVGDRLQDLEIVEVEIIIKEAGKNEIQ